jgi:hypothetical protein
MKLFLTGFLQVFFVSANTYFISKTTYSGIAVCGFSVSYLWTLNVKKVSISTRNDRLFYSFGAMSGGLIGVWIANLIK